jgi:cobaltochelatase CobN
VLKAVFFTAVENDLIPLTTALKRIRSEKGQVIDVQARTRRDLDEGTQFVQFKELAKEADVAIFHLHGGEESCPGFAEFMEYLQGDVKVHIQPSSAEDIPTVKKYTSVSQVIQQQATAYMQNGGIDNYYNLLLFLANELTGTDFPVKEPQALPWEGIYHPDFVGVPSLDEYLEKKYNPGRLTVGLWFHRNYWVNGNTAFVDALIREVESKNANVIPVFMQSAKDVNLGNQGADGVVENFFLREGRPLVDVLINLLMFSITMRVDRSEIVSRESKGIMEKLGVPFIQGITTLNTREEWENNLQGLNPMDVSISVAMPEFDGALITVPVSAREITEFDAVTGANITKFIPIPERVAKLVRLSMRWGRLRHLPNEEKKIAIIFHNYPPRNDNIGSAFGLDSPASVWNILNNLQEAGYKLDYLPEDGQVLIEDILDRVTNDRRWASAQELMQRAVDSVSPEQYCGWFQDLPEEVRDKMTECWGQPPGEVFCYGNKLLIPGIINGNIFIGLQPPRGFLDDPAKIYHSPDLPIPHHYLAYYRWIRDVFCADAVMHIGKHGSLEWLPGKGVGLSASCYPDLVISDLPNIYPYIINNPGEGTQAKRRSYCCIIDHLVPVMHNADSYEEMAEVEKQLEDYYNARAQDPAKLPYLEKLVWEKVCEVKLNHDLGLAEEEIPADFNAFVEKLHSYLSELKDTQIRDGLHILGEPPIGTRLVEFLVALTRLPNGDVPSLRQSLAEMWGYDYEQLLANRGKMNTNGKTNGQILEDIHQLSLDLMACFEEVCFDENEVRSVSKEILGKTNPKVEEVLLYVAQFLADRLAATTDELTNARNALDGQFIPAGPSGAPTRGMANILPTGRNFYSVDPQAIPSPAAWKVGVELADNLLARYLSDEGCYPENIGIIIWGTGVMRTKGDDIAEILYLLGVRPVWQPESGRVKGIEVIPLEELKRPRIDVTLRISGLFRDAFPNIVEMIDEAVERVAFLDEPPEQNFLAKHVQKDITDKVEQGFDLEQAREDACYRIFGCKPGAYGAGVSDLIDAQNWRDEQDLGQVYVVWGGYAYGKKQYGKVVPEIFKYRLSQLDVAVKNVDNREYDMMDSDDFYSYHGGMIAAVRAFKGENPQAYIGDSSDPERIKTRSAAEEAKHVFRARLLNPKWIHSMQRHGYKGAADISRTVDFAFGWDATAEVLEDWMYEQLAKKYALDEEMQEWLKDVNPYALQNLIERLLEAVQRGMWEAEPQMKQELQDIYLEVEGKLEESQEKSLKKLGV